MVSSRLHLFLQKTYVLGVGQCTGVTLPPNVGTPLETCGDNPFFAATAAIIGFLHLFNAVLDAAGLSCVFLAAAAAAPLCAQAGRPRDCGRMILTLAPAPNDGCGERIPGESCEGSAQRNRPVGLMVALRRGATSTSFVGEQRRMDQRGLPDLISDEDPAGRGNEVCEKANASLAWWTTPQASRRQLGRRRPSWAPCTLTALMGGPLTRLVLRASLRAPCLGLGTAEFRLSEQSDGECVARPGSPRLRWLGVTMNSMGMGSLEVEFFSASMVN